MRKNITALIVLVLALPLFAVSPPQSVDDVDILRLNQKMARYLLQEVSPRLEPKAQVYALNDLILGKKGLDISYEKTGTKSAIDAFESRSGNCLSFTILFVAMARHLGLDAYFEEVSEVVSWDRRGDIVVRNQHMFVEVEILNGHITVDFLPGAEKRYHQVRRIGEQRALAHFYNNLAVDALTGDDMELAVAYFEKALKKDASFSPAWTNLGVTYRRQGDFERAEQSHLKALEVEPGEHTAAANLASLYLAMGRRDEAQPLLRRVDDHLRKSPFYRFQQGSRSLEEGDSAAAVRHFRAAIRMMPKESQFHMALADAFVAANDREKARESLHRAIELVDEEEKARLEQELASLGGS